MKKELLALLRCPSCGSPASLGLAEVAGDGQEVREGELHCHVCELCRPVTGGIADLLLDPPPQVVAEAKGLERFAELMRHDGWDRARILSLPYEDNGYWFGQAQAMTRLCEAVPFTPGQLMLDVGANTCWASAIFARAGLDTVALDISMTEMQGLRTADWWFEDMGVYFERVLGQMSHLPFSDNSFDWVFCCEVLHHNDRAGMSATMHEIHRILRPGGRLLVANEPLRWPTDLKRDHAAEVAQFDGNEHVYFAPEYLCSAWRAGFRCIQLLEPTVDGLYSQQRIHLMIEASTLGSFKLAVKNVTRKHPLIRNAYKWLRYLIGPGTSLQMICTKRF